MRSTALKLTVAILLFCCIIQVTNAQDKINVVTTAVPFLRISPDARAGGMGDVGLATSPDAGSGFWNLGKVPFNETKAGILATYTPWLKDLVNDVYLASISGYVKIDDMQALSGSIRYFSLGDIQFTDGAGQNLNTYRPREYGLDIGYSRKLGNKTGLGIGLKYINSSLASGGTGTTTYKPGSAVAADIGLYFNNQNATGNGWSFGVALANLGSKIAYTDNANVKDFIPANLGIGTAYTKNLDASNKLTFGLDINKLLVPTPPKLTGDFTTDQQSLNKYRSKSVIGSWFSSFGDAPGGLSEELKEFQISVGGEYWYNNQFAFRAGYFYENKNKGNRRYFTAGLGLKYNIFGLNFSYLVPSGSGVNRNPLSNTLRFSVFFDLDGNSKK